MRNRGYRVTFPRCTKHDKPWVPWAEFNGDAVAAWDVVKTRALDKLKAEHPEWQL
jgi:hypothetical protein